MITISTEQLAELNEGSEEQFVGRLRRYLDAEVPEAQVEVRSLIDQARRTGLVSEREIAMFSVFVARTGDAPVHPDRCYPKRDDERVEQFRVRFDSDLTGWMAANGFEPI